MIHFDDIFYNMRKISMRKLNKYRKALVFISMVLVLSGCGAKKEDDLVPPPEPHYDAVLPTTTIVERGDVEPSYELKLELMDYANIRYKYSLAQYTEMSETYELEVEDVSVNVGDMVHEGDIMVSFHSEVLDEKIDSHLTISTNVSVRHLMKNNFLDETREIIEEYQIPADRIEIEITESIMIDSTEKALSVINELKNMGIKIAIDDFGTGYSSLSYLNSLPSDMLKIDKSFIDVMNDSESTKEYVAMIISIGHILHLEVISEGVESPEQIETLRKVGCDYIQGYVWGRPMSPEDAMTLALEA